MQIPPRRPLILYFAKDKIYFDTSDLYITALNFLGEEAKDQWTEDDVMEAILRVLQKMK